MKSKKSPKGDPLRGSAIVSAHARTLAEEALRVVRRAGGMIETFSLRHVLCCQAIAIAKDLETKKCFPVLDKENLIGDIYYPKPRISILSAINSLSKNQAPKPLRLSNKFLAQNKIFSQSKK